MINIIVSFIYLIISFSITVICFKRFGKYGLYMWMCILIIISNIQTVKMADFFGLSVSLGNISYGAIFLTTDILSEKYGRKSTNMATKISFLAMIVFAILMVVFLQYQPSEIDASQGALVTIFGYIPRITIASLCSYYISQHCDAFLYSKLKTKYNKVYISNNVSTFVSQIVDTLIFVMLSFIGVMEFRDVLELIITMILFKWVIAILDTPFMLLVTKIKNKELE